MMKKFMTLISLVLLALAMTAADTMTGTIRLTIVNKSETDIAVQLYGTTRPCCNKADVDKGENYYLPVAEGSRDKPTVKQFDIERNTYTMRMIYISTYDPVYGFKCEDTAPNPLIARNNLRVVVLPCNELPNPWAVGERTMWKYVPYPIESLARVFDDYWKTRLIY